VLHRCYSQNCSEVQAKLISNGSSPGCRSGRNERLTVSLFLVLRYRKCMLGFSLSLSKRNDAVLNTGYLPLCWSDEQ
jgi:hypothetical protein